MPSRNKNGAHRAPRRKLHTRLRQSLRQPRYRLHDVVIDHYHGEQHQKHKRRLVYPLLDLYADISADDSFDDQHQDHPAIENRYWQQVEDAEIQTDSGHQAQQGSPARLAGGLARRAGDSNRSLHLLDRGLVAHHLPHQVYDEQRVFLVLVEGSAQRLRERQLIDAHRLRLEAQPIALLSVVLRHDWSGRELHRLAVAQCGNFHRLVAVFLQETDDREQRSHRRAVDRHDLVTDMHACFGGRHLRFHLGHDNRLVLHPPDASYLFRVRPVTEGSDLLFQNLVAPLDRQIERLVALNRRLQQHVFPAWVFHAVDTNNSVTGLDAGLFRWRVLHHPANHR